MSEHAVCVTLCHDAERSWHIVAAIGSVFRLTPGFPSGTPLALVAGHEELFIHRTLVARLCDGDGMLFRTGQGNRKRE